MNQIWMETATGLVCFGSACFCGIRWNRKKHGKGEAFFRWGIPAGFLLLFALTVVGFCLYPAEGALRQAEQIAVLAAVLFCAVTDLSDRIIPNAAVLVLAGVVAAFAAAEAIWETDGGWQYWLDRILGFVLAFSVLGISGLMLKEGIGGGDLKLLSVLGFSYGLYGTVSVMILSFLPCAVCGMGLLLSRRGTRKSTLPLGPFLAVGVIVYTLLCWMGGQG